MSPSTLNSYVSRMPQASSGRKPARRRQPSTQLSRKVSPGRGEVGSRMSQRVSSSTTGRMAAPSSVSS